MRKTITLGIISLLTIFSLVGCGQKEGYQKDGSYETEYIKLAEYKNLKADKDENVEVKEEDIDNYVVNVLTSYYANDEKNKEKTFKATDLTDALVKEITSNEYKTVNDYRNYIRTVIKTENQSYTNQAIKENLFKQVVEKSELKKYEESDLEKYKKYSEQYYKEYANYQKKDFEKFKKEDLKVADDKAYNELIEKEAKENVKTQYVIQAIAKKESMEIKDERVNEQIQQYINSGSFETETDVLNYISKEEIKTNLLYYDILDLVYNNANLGNESTSGSAISSSAIVN